MIHEWNISNFKALPADRITHLDLRALNVFVGPNSSGKSTLIQSILLIAQTLKNSSGERPLILNGELVRLGHANEVIHEGNENKPLRIYFTFFNPENSNNLEKIQIKLEFELPEISNLGFDLMRVEISKGENIGIIAQKSSQKVPQIMISSHDEWIINNILKNKIMQGYFDYNVLRYSSNKLQIGDTLKEALSSYISFFHFLPESNLEIYNNHTEILSSAMRQLADELSGQTSHGIQQNYMHAIKPKSKLEKLFIIEIQKSFERVIESYARSAGGSKKIYSRSDTTRSVTDQIIRTLISDLTSVEKFNSWKYLVQQKLTVPTKRKISQQLRTDALGVEQKSKKDKSKQDESGLGVRANLVSSDLDAVNQQIIEFFKERIHYLGPLRDDPRAIYGIPLNPETKDIGKKGEYTAAVMERYKNEPINCPIPPNNIQDLGKVHTTSLISGIAEWLRYLGLVDNIRTNDLGKIGYEMTVNSPGVKKELDLTNVGVGVSQVLPTIVIALLSAPDSLLLMEQPELHLHPKVQSRLGDFLVAVSLSGRQCIIETHSEYLVNRIRRRIVEAEGRTLLDKTSIYFVEGTPQGSDFSRIQPNEYGAILKWPRGFFDEGPAEAEMIMDASMKKRKIAKL
jgi:predicted ATPase